MDKKVILAVAGSGKTYHICNVIDKSKKNLIIGYTNRNIINIEKELVANCVNTNKTIVYTFHKFLYNFFIRPFEVSIGELFNFQIKSRGLSMVEPPKPIDNAGKYNKSYYTKDKIYHYMKNDRYYSSNLSELVIYLKDKSDIFKRAMRNINSFFDFIAVDEFQDFRDFDYRVLEAIIEYSNSILLVGDYYQHSVSGKETFGPPFEIKTKNNVTKKFENNYISYETFKENLRNQGIDVDDQMLKKSRRCSLEVCNFVKEKLKIDIQSALINNGKVYLVEDSNELNKILKDDSIVKIIFNAPYKWNFRCESWSYCKGDTFQKTCIILTKAFNQIKEEKFSINDISQKTINMLYVALTRTKGDLYIVCDDLFSKVKKSFQITSERSF